MSEFHSSVFEIWRVKNGPKIAQNPLQTPVTRYWLDGYNRHFAPRLSIPSHIFWHQFHLSTWKSPFRDSGVPRPHPYQEATCAKPYNSLVYLTDPNEIWHAFMECSGLEACQISLRSIGKMKELLGFKVPKQLFWAPPKSGLTVISPV